MPKHTALPCHLILKGAFLAALSTLPDPLPFLLPCMPLPRSPKVKGQRSSMKVLHPSFLCFVVLWLLPLECRLLWAGSSPLCSLQAPSLEEYPMLRRSTHLDEFATIKDKFYCPVIDSLLQGTVARSLNWDLKEPRPNSPL